MDSDHEYSGINPFRQITRGHKDKKDRLFAQAVANQRQKCTRTNPATVRHWVNSAMKQIIDLLRPITPFLKYLDLTIFRKPMYKLIITTPCVHG